MSREDEEAQLKEVALRNASTIFKARQRAEQDLVQVRDSLQQKTGELAHSLAMMKATLDSATDGILVTDETSTVTSFNLRFVEMWQPSAKALMAKDHGGLMDGIASLFAAPDEVKARVGEINREAPLTTFDVLTPLDGRVIERHSRPQVVDGRIVGRVWTFRDTTEHRRAEEALRDETRVLAILNRIGSDLAANLDLRVVVQGVTDAGKEISGAKTGAFFYNVTDSQSTTVLLYALSGASREEFERCEPLAQALLGPVFRGHKSIRCDDIKQDLRYVPWTSQDSMSPGLLAATSYLAVPVVSRSGEMIGGLLFSHPEPRMFSARSEQIIAGVAAQAAVALDNARMYEAVQRAAEERQQLLDSERSARNLAERMSALKDDFLSTLSHELRTPLSAIMGWTQILRRGSQSAEELKKGLDTIERNSRLQIQLIDDLLDMNRITSGKVRLDIQPVSPILIIEAALENAAPSAQGKGVRIERILDPSVGAIPGDPGRLQQVMSNLISNAVKFTPRGGKVQVLLERVNSHVEITVADSGIGIKPEFLPHVFDRFRQEDASTTRKYGGLGLGLSIVKSLVELHGGTVRAASEGEGRGTAFCVHLPVPLVRGYGPAEHRQHPRAAREPEAFVAVDLAGLRILVVDDDADGRDLVCRVLLESEATVFAAGNADEALALVDTHRPDILVSDIGMPDVDGYELLRRVRARGVSNGGRLPAIALTAFARSQDRTQALRAGFAAHLTKPVDASELLATIASIAGRGA